MIRWLLVLSGVAMSAYAEVLTPAANQSGGFQIQGSWFVWLVVVLVCVAVWYFFVYKRKHPEGAAAAETKAKGVVDELLALAHRQHETIQAQAATTSSLAAVVASPPVQAVINAQPAGEPVESAIPAAQESRGAVQAAWVASWPQDQPQTAQAVVSQSHPTGETMQPDDEKRLCAQIAIQGGTQALKSKAYLKLYGLNGQDPNTGGGLTAAWINQTSAGAGPMLDGVPGDYNPEELSCIYMLSAPGLAKHPKTPDQVWAAVQGWAQQGEAVTVTRAWIDAAAAYITQLKAS